MKPRISKTNEFYARECNHSQSAQQQDIGIYLCAPRDKHSQMTSWRGHDAGLSQPKGNCSSLAKITTNFRVAESNGFSVFISLLSCIQHSWTFPPEMLSVSILLAAKASLGLDLPSTHLVTSCQSSWLAPSLHLHSKSWNTPRAWSSTLFLFFTYTISLADHPDLSITY